jgi:TonB-linked SusC/RagA family outer membrane protein
MRFRGVKTALLAALALTVAGAAQAAAQATGTVRGVVMDAMTSRPLPSAQVSVQGTQIGGLTDQNGRFTIANVPAGPQTINVQLIGYGSASRNVTVEAGQIHTVNITLATEAVALQEIVVTGVAGATPRAKLPFTVDKVSAEDLPVPAVSAAGMLQGKVAGASVVSGTGRPGVAPDVLLRAPTSINASGRGQAPLYIVDGVILGASLIDIDALDIESMEVIKGAAAASFYGARAAAGVIQIVTRTGRGVAMDQQRYTFRSEIGRNYLPSTLYPLPQNHAFQMNAAGTRFVDNAGVEFDWLEETRKWHEQYYAGIPDPAVRTPVVRGANAWSQFMDQTYPGAQYDAVREFLQPGTKRDVYISAEGRTGATNYHASFSDARQGGILEGLQGYDRQSFRINLDQGVGERVTLSGRAFYSRSSADGQNSEGSGSPFFTLTRMPTNVSLRETTADGELFIRPNYVRENANPLYEIINTDRFDERTRFLGGANLRWTPIAFLDFDGNLSYDRSDVERRQYNFRGFRTARPGSLADGYLYHDGWYNEAINASGTATLRRSFGDLNTRTQVRYSYEDQTYAEDRASGFGQTVEGIRTLRAFPQDRRIDSTNRSVVGEGYFFITNFDLRDRYIVDLLLRRDGSSLFGVNERYHNYYRAAGAWRVSEEPWFTAPLDEVKLRYSIGTAGGRPIFAAQYETYGIDLASGLPLGGVTLGNPDLKPEHSTEQEMGIDVGARGATFSLTYATTETADQILSAPLPALTGFARQWRNAGTLQSHTWEASLDVPVIRGDRFSWSSRLLWDRTRQEITQLNIPAYQTGLPEAVLQGGSRMFWVREGEAIGTFYGTRWATSCGDLPADVQNLCATQFATNVDGYLVWVGEGNTTRSQLWDTNGPVIRNTAVKWGAPIAAQNADGDTFLPIGSTQPDFNFSFANTLNFAGFSVYGLLDATIGADVYNYPRHWAYHERAHADLDQAHLPVEDRKPLGYYSALYASLGPPTSHFVEDGSFVKLRELAVRYRFDGAQLGRMPLVGGMSGVTVGLVGRNLFTWTNYSGFDPEVGVSGGDFGSASINRFDGFSYPNFRTLSASVELNF